MPPEQFTGAPIDGRADLFSLGVILYSLATGEQPFPGETMTSVSYKVVHTEPIPPAKLNPAIPARLEAVIMKCLAKSPADRYQTGEELAQDLAAIRTGATPSAMQSMAATAGGSDRTLGPAATPSSIPPGFNAASLAASLQPGPSAGFQGAAKKTAQPARAESVFGMALLSVAGLAIVAAGGWFWYQHHKQAMPAQQQASTPPAPQPAAPAMEPEIAVPALQGQPAAAAPAPGATPAAAPANPAAKPSPAKPSAGTSQPPAPAAPAPGAKPPATPAAPANPQQAAGAPAASFDPRKADPNKNGKLKIDVSKFPNGLAFTVNRNRQAYLQFVTGDGANLDNLYVPPGVQTFRVTIKSGGQEWASNIVSDDFKAKKTQDPEGPTDGEGQGAGKGHSADRQGCTAFRFFLQRSERHFAVLIAGLCNGTVTIGR